MRFVDLTGLHLRAALKTRALPWGQPLAEADSGPLIGVGEHSGLRVISVAFALEDSDWPLRVSFPIFLTNAVRWLSAGSAPGAASPETPTGGVASLTVPSGAGSLTIIRPDGSQSAVSAPVSGGTVLVDDTRQVGIYHAKTSAGADYPFAVNLDSAAEGHLAAQTPPVLTHAGASAAPVHLPPSRRAKNDLWPTLAAVALALLLAEWFVFHRRI